MKKITHQEIERILDFEISENVKKKLKDFDLSYRELTQEERENYLLHVINVLINDITVSGKHRLNEWEVGWGENFENFRTDSKVDNLIPKYHGKNRIVRFNGDVVMPLVDNFDYKIHISFVDSILHHYLKDIKNVFEFGCGPGYHLLRLSQYDNNLNLYGSDWTTASQKIIQEINSSFNTNIVPFNFDFFNPDYNVVIPENSAVYTVAALEQIGKNFETFVNFLIEKKPKICIHLEPIDELLDDNKLIDSLSIKYFRKRNYLNGFLPYLEKLESEGKIEIIKKQRIYSGSYFIEGHSLIVWKIL